MQYIGYRYDNCSMVNACHFVVPTYVKTLNNITFACFQHFLCSRVLCQQLEA